MYLLQQGELLADVLCAVFVLAEGEWLLTVQADVGEARHQGAVERHRQRRGDGEGLVFRQGCRRLHHSRESPLKRFDKRGDMLFIVTIIAIIYCYYHTNCIHIRLLLSS